MSGSWSGQLGERVPQLRASRRRTEAEVRPGPEREVGVGV
jgi:hypothetical protein